LFLTGTFEASSTLSTSGLRYVFTTVSVRCGALDAFINVIVDFQGLG